MLLRVKKRKKSSAYGECELFPYIHNPSTHTYIFPVKSDQFALNNSRTTELFVILFSELQDVDAHQGSWTGFIRLVVTAGSKENKFQNVATGMYWQERRLDQRVTKEAVTAQRVISSFCELAGAILLQSSTACQ